MRCLTLEQLPTAWRERAELIRPYAEPAAKAWDAAAEELEHQLRDREDELLNLTQASKECGYTPDWLGRLIRRERLDNYGRSGAPKVRRGDLPKKATMLQAKGTEHVRAI